jgi:hypothetical protein
MVARYLPDHILLGTIDIAVIRSLLSQYAPGHHLTRSQGKGSRKAKKAAQTEDAWDNEVKARLVSEGWTLADNPPNTDRVVQVAWDDGSTGPTSLAFYDGKAEIPPGQEKFWWAYPGLSLLENVTAWIERNEDPQAETLGD